MTVGIKRIITFLCIVTCLNVETTTPRERDRDRDVCPALKLDAFQWYFYCFCVAHGAQLFLLPTWNEYTVNVVALNFMILWKSQQPIHFKFHTYPNVCTQWIRKAFEQMCILHKPLKSNEPLREFSIIFWSFQQMKGWQRAAPWNGINGFIFKTKWFHW